MKIWEPKLRGTLWATPGLLQDSFIYTFTTIVCPSSHRGLDAPTHQQRDTDIARQPIQGVDPGDTCTYRHLHLPTPAHTDTCTYRHPTQLSEPKILLILLYLFYLLFYFYLYILDFILYVYIIFYVHI